MEIVRGFSRRLFMTGLFAGALMTTFHFISGVEVRDLERWLDHHISVGKSGQKVFLKSMNMETTLQKKLFPVEAVIEQAFRQNSRKTKAAYLSRTVVATGYTAGVESTGKTSDHPMYGVTYSGVKVTRDFFSTIAADPSVFPIGSILYIPDYGMGVVADTGSAIKGNKIDLYYPTVRDVYQEWGRKKVRVYVLKTGSGTLSRKMMDALNGGWSVGINHQAKYRQTVTLPKRMEI